MALDKNESLKGREMNGLYVTDLQIVQSGPLCLRFAANGGSGVSRFFQALAKTVGVSPTPTKGISLTDLDSDPSPDNPLEEENDFTTQGAQRRLINHNTLMRSKSAREPLPMAEPPIPYTIDGSRMGLESTIYSPEEEQNGSDSSANQGSSSSLSDSVLGSIASLESEGSNALNANFGTFEFHRNKWRALVIQFRMSSKEIIVAHYGEAIHRSTFEGLLDLKADKSLSHVFTVDFANNKHYKLRTQTENDRTLIVQLYENIKKYVSTPHTLEEDKEFASTTYSRHLQASVVMRGTVLHKHLVKWSSRTLEISKINDEDTEARFNLYRMNDLGGIPLKTICIYSLDSLALSGETGFRVYACGRNTDFRFGTKAERDDWFNVTQTCLLTARPNFVIGSHVVDFSLLHSILEPKGLRFTNLKFTQLQIVSKQEALTGLNVTKKPPGRSTIKTDKADTW
ncbi:hypothetical protein PROFUN_03321 [Planoprotostelium fungivorum]|uniref:Uncharacterized protein n=1 Tax=Planoprotostelium fungivorum TaxID=1890364 RepID=A0A2P6NWS4_9EUKA|nr:hypothetical protein PROFUN_03321 [Planoprotostelium fungivorum]